MSLILLNLHVLNFEPLRENPQLIHRTHSAKLVSYMYTLIEATSNATLNVGYMCII